MVICAVSIAGAVMGVTALAARWINLSANVSGQRHCGFLATVDSDGRLSTGPFLLRPRSRVRRRVGYAGAVLLLRARAGAARLRRLDLKSSSIH